MAEDDVQLSWEPLMKTYEDLLFEPMTDATKAFWFQVEPDVTPHIVVEN